jgi:hypothetical protein
MAGVIKTHVQLGDSGTATNNFMLTAQAADGTMKLARGNNGATTQDVITVDTNGKVAFAQGAAGSVLTMGTAQATTSGTAFDFTIPSWARRITINVNALSTNGTSIPCIRIGTGGTPVTSGYIGCAAQYNNTPVITTSALSGSFLLAGVWTSSAALHGTATLCLANSTNLWVFAFTGGRADLQATHTTGGSITLASTLDIVRLTTAAGDAFDTGAVNILYE